MPSFLKTQHHSDEGLAALMENNSTFACVFDDAGLIVDVGPEMAAGFQRKDGPLAGRSLAGLVQGEASERAVADMFSNRNSNRSMIELCMNGTGGPVSVRWVVFPLALYGRSGFIGLGWPERDWTAMHQLMINLGRCVEFSMEAVLVVNSRGIVEYVNPAFCRISGYGLEESLGAPVSAVAGVPEDIGVVREAMACFREGKSWHGSVMIRRKDGAAVSMSITVQPVADYAGVRRYMVMGEDFSRQRTLERKVEELQRTEALGTLANGLAHRFNNILAAISGQTELLIMSSKDKSVVSRAQKILDSALKGKEVVEQIGLFGRRSEPRSRLADIVPVLRNAVRFIRAAQPSAVQIVDNLPEAGPELMVNTGEIHQAAINLLTNSLEAIGRNAGKIEVSLRRLSCSLSSDAPPVECICLEVRDDGSGIDPQIQPRIFDPFFTTHGLANSSGMGLAITQGIAKRHGGVVRFESQPGEGSVFYVYLPLLRSDGESSPSRSPSVRKGRILLVDRSGFSLESGANLLRDMGHDVVAVSTVADAKHVLSDRSQPFSLLITALVLEDGSGVALCRFSRRSRSGMPVLLCADLSDSFDEEAALDAGASSILRRPVPREGLEQVVLKLLDCNK